MSERNTVGILGASGFIGSRLVEWLILHELANVRPIVRSFRGLARLARFDLDSRLADATDQTALETQLKGCEIVFHCVVGGRETILGSLDATYRAAAAAGVRRLVYLSSAVVHGHDPLPGTDEQSALLRHQPFEYNVSKAMAEWRLAELRQDGKVETVVLRPSIVFGPRSTYWTAQIATDLINQRAFLIEGGSGICNTVYIDNLVHAMWLAGTQPGVVNQAFFVTDDERVTWRDLYASVATGLGIDPDGIRIVSLAEVKDSEKAAMKRHSFLRFQRSRLGDAVRELMPARVKRALRELLSDGAIQLQGDITSTKRGLVIDPEIASLQRCRSMLPVAKAEQLLGYKPKVTFNEGCRRTAAWLRFAYGMNLDA